MPEKKHIIIIGAGFAGLRLARNLNNHPSYSITLIDKNNYHQFQPLLYQVATANLDASNISFPLRNIFKGSKNVSIRIAEVISIHPEEKSIQTSTGILNYDYLVIATGADTNFFGNIHIQNNAFPMKSTWEALQIRNKLIQNFEEASVSTDKTNIERLLNIVIVGGGPTGVELSGAVAEMKRDSLPKEYPELNFSTMKIYLLEGMDKLLGNFSKASSAKSEKYLLEMGVIVKTNTIVKDYDGSKVLLQDGALIPASIMIWAAGIKGKMPAGIRNEWIANGNRIKTDTLNRVINSNNIFALGDIAYIESETNPKGYPQLASVAIDQAKNLAENFKRMSNGKPLREYQYTNKGAMATVGRNKAVVDLELPRISFQGFLAWFIWMSLHLFLLIGFKNRLIVFINWIYKYLTRSQSLALLFAPLFNKKNNEKT